MDISIIQQQLEKVNLSSEEALVYASLLQLGEVSVLKLARKTGLKRPSVYNYLKTLTEKKLIRWNNTPRGQTVAATDPENLSLQLDREREKYRNLVDVLNNLLPELNSLKVQKNFSTQVRYYEGVQGIKQLITNTLNARKEIFGYSCYGRNQVVGKDFMKDFRDKWVKAKLFDYVIVNNLALSRRFPKEVLVKDYLKYQKIRILPEKEFYITGDIMIYNNVYAVASLDQKNSMGVEIINEEIVKTQMSIFKLLWKIAKPIDWKTA